MKLDIRISLIACLLTALATFYFTNKNSKTEIVEKEVIRKDVQTVIKEVIKKDGSKEVTTIITDKTKIKNDSKKTTIVAKPNYIIGAGYGKSFIDNKDIYSISVQKRVLPNAFLGVTGTTEKQVLLTVSMEF